MFRRPARVSIVCTASLRHYFWPYTEDFVPAGAVTSSFQSSSVPSVRQRIVREYALGPLFGQPPLPCCVLGFQAPARYIIQHKETLRQTLAPLLGGPVQLGPLRQAKEMLLYRRVAGESPLLGDEEGSFAYEQKRRTTYAREPITAITALEVYYDTDGTTTTIEEEDEEVLATGLYLRDLWHRYQKQQNDKNSENNHNNAILSEEEMKSAEALVALGVTHIIVPTADESDFHYSLLHGEEVEEALAERVQERWARRLALVEAYEADKKEKKDEHHTIE